MSTTAYIASTAGGRAVKMYHTDEECRLGPSEKRKREITVAKAKDRDLELCSVCGGTVTPNKGNDPHKYIRELQNQ